MSIEIKNTPCSPCPVGVSHDYFTLMVANEAAVEEPVLVCRKCGSFILIKEGIQKARKAAQESDGLPSK